jgi:hypothetical protein
MTAPGRDPLAAALGAEDGAEVNYAFCNSTGLPVRADS